MTFDFLISDFCDRWVSVSSSAGEYGPQLSPEKVDTNPRVSQSVSLTQETDFFAIVRVHTTEASQGAAEAQ